MLQHANAGTGLTTSLAGSNGHLRGRWREGAGPGS